MHNIYSNIQIDMLEHTFVVVLVLNTMYQQCGYILMSRWRQRRGGESGEDGPKRMFLEMTKTELLLQSRLRIGLSSVSAIIDTVQVLHRFPKILLHQQGYCHN